MDQQPPFEPERRIASPEARAAYKAFQDSIKAGSCDLRKLQDACRKGDITKEQRNALGFILAEKLDSMVGVDPLTKLFNRAYLETEINRVKEELNYKGEEKRKFPVQSVMVIYLDIDKMKDLNNAHPDHHTVGDKALVTIANRLTEGTKKTDTILRVGGDEFVAVLPINHNNPRTLTAIFERIKRKINADLFVDINGTNIPFTVSIGFEILNKGDNTTAKELLLRADQKMYEDKDGGK